MRIVALGLVALAALCGCGSGGGIGTAPGAKAGRWCSDLPGLTADPATNLTGVANTLKRVRRVQERYSKQLFRCPDVVGFGIGNLKVYRDRVPRSRRPPHRSLIRPSDKENVLDVFLRTGDRKPRDPLYLDGVLLHFEVTGNFYAQ